ncbi:MAG: AAA family ATPase [Planctomycetes bacterium]|nr:AAA family ATPase [Planctomycetota bacterium]
MAERYRCIMLFGAPGVGKGTQGKMLGELEGFVHLATGDMFRGLDQESELGQEFLKYSTRGELVPDEFTVRLWQQHVADLVGNGHYDPSRDILFLDGIPRTVTQAEKLDPLVEPLAVVHLRAQDLDEMVHRMKLRAEKEGRPDDADEAVIRRRFEVYEEETSPVLGHYDAGLILEIDAIGSIEEVFDRIQEALKSVEDEQLSGTSR